MIDIRRPTHPGPTRPGVTRRFGWIALLLTGALLQACGPNAIVPGSRLRVYAADVSGKARSCEVPKITPADGHTTDAAIKLDNDGGWCGLPVFQPGPKPYDAGLLIARPAHGTVLIHEVGDETRIDYTPDRGFTGTDSFTVKLLPGSASIHIAATVIARVAATGTTAPAK